MTASPATPALNQEIVQKIERLFTQLDKWKAHLANVTAQFNSDKATAEKALEEVLDQEPSADAWIDRVKDKGDKKAKHEARSTAIHEVLKRLQNRRDALARDNKGEMLTVLRQIMDQKSREREDIEHLEVLWKKLTGKAFRRARSAR